MRRRPHRRLVRTAAAATAAAAALVGCGNKTIDAGKLEATVKSRIEEQQGLRVEEVDCPDHRKAKAGDTFACRAAVAGQEVRMRVDQRDDGRLDVVYDQAILSPAKVAEQMRAQLSDKTGVALTVDCGNDEVLVRDVGGTFQCVATDPSGAPARVVATVLNTAGEVSFEVPGT